MLLPIAIGMLTALPEMIGFLGVALLISSILFFYSAIKQFASNAKQKKANANFIQQINKQNKITNIAKQHDTIVNENIDIAIDCSSSLSYSINNNNSVIANWQLSNEDWIKFYKNEKKERITSIIIEVFWILLLGTILLKNTRMADTLDALLVSGLIGGVYGFGKYFLTMKSISPDVNSTENKEICITNSSILINGKLNIFNDETRWFKSAKLLDNTNPLVVEITFGWKTRRGNTYDEIRIPVNNKETANNIISSLYKKNN